MIELKFKIIFGSDRDFETTDKFENLLTDGAVREELEWEVQNVIYNWMNPDRHRVKVGVELVG